MQDILEAFGALRCGERIDVLAGHDLTPLWYRFELEWTDAYRWRWIQRGPDRWRAQLERVAFGGRTQPQFHRLPRNPGCPRMRRSNPQLMTSPAWDNAASRTSPAPS